mgnify:CR=1 FL=1
MSAPRTKPGQHGPLYRYQITYRDGVDGPTFKQRVWAYSLEHAEARFYDGPDGDTGWVAVSAQRVPESGILARVPVHRLA